MQSGRQKKNGLFGDVGSQVPARCFSTPCPRTPPPRWEDRGYRLLEIGGGVGAQMCEPAACAGSHICYVLLVCTPIFNSSGNLGTSFSGHFSQLRLSGVSLCQPVKAGPRGVPGGTCPNQSGRQRPHRWSPIRRASPQGIPCIGQSSSAFLGLV